MEDGEDPLGSIPRYAIYRRRKMRVLAYEGNNKFTLLGPGDERFFVDRSRFTFVKEAKRAS